MGQLLVEGMMSSLSESTNFKKQSDKFQRINLIYCNCHPVVCAFSNFSERQILWSLCSVVFVAFTLRLPIQTSLPVVFYTFR